MTKKKTVRKKCLFVVQKGGNELQVIREDGKYWYTATSQFRKGAFTVIEREALRGAESGADTEKEKNGEQQ